MPRRVPLAAVLPTTRRRFLQSGAALGALAAAGGVHAAGSDVLKVGLVGCGGRGTGAAAQALQADRHARLTAMADAFADRLEASLENLHKIEPIAGKLDVPPERRFVGFDAYRQVLASGVDVVLLCTPPHFRPLHLEAAIAAGKHVFAEKPCAVDAPGVRSVLATCDRAREKGLSVVSGLCLRSSLGFRELMQRVHDGQIGRIVAMQANDYRGPIWVKPRQPEWTDMEYQMRNWYYFTWLSGDFNVEQHVHFLDVCAWAMQDQYPARAIGMGGREVRRGPDFGNIFDHHSVVYEYADGTRLFSNTRQMRGCASDMSALLIGTRGRALISERQRGLVIEGHQPWVYEGPDNNIYQTEHDEMFAAIRSGTPINNGRYMALSSLLAIQGRMATYTGQRLKWDDVLNSVENLSPAAYAWDAKVPETTAAVPGVTRFL